jgi:hypothetical protein
VRDNRIIGYVEDSNASTSRTGAITRHSELPERFTNSNDFDAKKLVRIGGTIAGDG